MIIGQMKEFRQIEAMLYSYAQMVTEIKLIELELEQLSMEYVGCSATQATNTPRRVAFASPVENEILAKEKQMEGLHRGLRNKQLFIAKIDTVLSTLNANEYTLISERYFNNKPFKEIAPILNMDEKSIIRCRRKLFSTKLYPLLSSNISFF